MRGEKILNVFFFICVLLMGYVLSFVFQIEKKHIEYKINILDAISFIATLLLAYIIYDVIDRNKEVRVREKEIILKKTDEFYSFIDERQKIIADNSVSFNHVSRIQKRIDSQIVIIESLIKQCNLTTGKDFKGEFRKLANDLNKLLTLTPTNLQITQGVIVEIVISNNIVTYTLRRLSDIEDQFESLKSKIAEYQIKINNS